MRVEQNTCENELRRRDARIDMMESEARVLREKFQSCDTTCSRKSNPCTLLRGQLSEQDATILLLKDELKHQADSMAALNSMVNYKQSSLENLALQMKRQIESESFLQTELFKKDRLIKTQYKTIKLLKSVDDQELFLEHAKDVALRILQNTVYSMVNNIKSCKDHTIRGLHHELDSMKGRIEPTEQMVRALRGALANSKALEEFHNDGERRQRSSMIHPARSTMLPVAIIV